VSEREYWSERGEIDGDRPAPIYFPLG